MSSEKFVLINTIIYTPEQPTVEFISTVLSREITLSFVPVLNMTLTLWDRKFKVESLDYSYSECYFKITTTQTCKTDQQYQQNIRHLRSSGWNDFVEGR